VVLHIVPISSTICHIDLAIRVHEQEGCFKKNDVLQQDHRSEFTIAGILTTQGKYLQVRESGTATPP